MARRFHFKQVDVPLAQWPESDYAALRDREAA